NMISVTRNTHMPSVPASRCCSMFSKWCCSALCAATSWVVASPSGNFVLSRNYQGDEGQYHPREWLCHRSNPLVEYLIHPLTQVVPSQTSVGRWRSNFPTTSLVSGGANS